MGFRIIPVRNTILLALIGASTPVPAVSPCPPGFLMPTAVTRYSTPIKVSAAIGVVFTRMTSPPAYDGIYVQAEPGFGGMKFNAGFRAGVHQFIPVASFSIGPSLMHTWGDPLQGVAPGQTYVGFEAGLCLLMLNLNGGFFSHVAGGASDDRFICSLGIGAGF